VPRKLPSTAQQILSESIWYKNAILKQNYPIFYKRLYMKNMKFVKELVDNQGNFLSHQQFLDKFGNSTVSFIEFNGMIQAIPKEWKTSIANYGKNIKNNTQVADILETIMKLKKPSKIFLNLLVESKIEQPPPSQNRWIEEIPEILKEDWSCNYEIAKIKTPDTKLQSFQFKILHRILATNSKLFHYGIKENDLCTFCSIEKEVYCIWFGNANILRIGGISFILGL
jgi:hypothetical protein